MKLTCDPNKRAITFKERGLDFMDAELIFDGSVYEFQDIRKEYGEQRMIAIRYLAERMILIGYVQRGEERHIFSMRKANEREIKKYKEQFEKS